MTLSTPNIFRRLSGTPDITRLKRTKTALLMIEFQAEHFTGVLPVDNREALTAAAVKAMDWADKNKILTVHVYHQAKSPASLAFAPDSSGAAFYPPIIPRKKHLTQVKYAASAFSGSPLHTILQTEGIDTLILAGLSTPSAITASAHDARVLGYKCLTAADLTASRDVVSWDESRVIPAVKMQETALANIADKYAQVLSLAEIMSLPIEK
ncbi:MAG: isochorismatase family protein [Alphaproteobacteria bacterium]|nr:isochorismatase family protein [Alphaproteobacteria bacterium]